MPATFTVPNPLAMISLGNLPWILVAVLSVTLFFTVLAYEGKVKWFFSSIWRGLVRAALWLRQLAKKFFAGLRDLLVAIAKKFGELCKEIFKRIPWLFCLALIGVLGDLNHNLNPHTVLRNSLDYFFVASGALEILAMVLLFLIRKKMPW